MSEAPNHLPGFFIEVDASGPDVAGYSLSQQQLDHLRELGIDPAPPSSPSATAKLVADQYLRTHPEPVMDPRLKSGSPQQHREAELVELLVALNYTGDARKAARGVPMEADLPATARRLIAAQPPAAPARSAETVLSRRL